MPFFDYSSKILTYELTYLFFKPFFFCLKMKKHRPFGIFLCLFPFNPPPRKTRRFHAKKSTSSEVLSKQGYKDSNLESIHSRPSLLLYLIKRVLNFLMFVNQLFRQIVITHAVQIRDPFTD